MRDLNYHIHTICLRNSDGSHQTKADRYMQLQQMANELHEIGFKRIRHPQNFKPKHIHALLKKWEKSERTGKPIAIGTLKNRMSHLRWLAEKIGNPTLIKSRNLAYGIGNRTFVGVDKAVEFRPEQISKIEDKCSYFSASLQQQFGLRREEAIKFSVGYADKGHKISLKPCWCKGGRGRDVPVTTQEQRELLDRIRIEMGNGSLIPNNLSYINQRNKYVKIMRNAGMNKTHGARHAFAQSRYTQITKEILTRKNGMETDGFLPPAKGGTRSKHMNPEDKAVDLEARKLLTEELGHGRVQIVANYLG